MKNNQQYIVSLCVELTQQGKHPSLAMIRNRSDRPLAIPEVVSVLKRWKKDPEQLESDHKGNNLQPEQVPLSLEKRVEHLEKQVEELTKLLAVTKLV